jgi:thymidylate synthase ThyX
VAEHAVLHLALENVSRLAIETIEGNRLASYTEKSTRYQQWDADAFYVPEELRGTSLAGPYEAICQFLLDIYHACIPKVQDWLRETQPKQPDESDSAFARRIRPAAVDICRFLLPAASLANVGVTINARALEYAICKMLSSPLDEVRQIGERILKVGKEEAPTLIKYAACNAYLMKVTKKLGEKAQGLKSDSGEELTLVDYDRDGEDKVLAAVLFRFSTNATYESCLAYVRGLDDAGRKSLVQDMMADRGRFDQPLREFEYAQMTFEAVMDQGAYFEFKRHRMMTQTVQPLTALLGYAVPKGIREAGCAAQYQEAMEKAADFYRELRAVSPNIAAYVVPNGFNRRVLFTLNLREAFTLCRLRAAANAHFSIRRVALKMFEAIEGIYPHLSAFMAMPEGTTWQDIANDYF